MSRAKLLDALRRAGRTFAQAAMAYFLVHPAGEMRDVTPRALLVGAVGAGLAGVWRLWFDPAEPAPPEEPEAAKPAVPPGK